MDNVLYTEQQAADHLQLKPRTLQAWRVRGGGPRFVRISQRCIRYRLIDLDKWIANRIFENTCGRVDSES